MGIKLKANNIWWDWECHVITISKGFNNINHPPVIILFMFEEPQAIMATYFC